jgi:cell wall-associated NlpC family hydrolase/LAS superfamily LD-carboxypeptidase LdcB
MTAEAPTSDGLRHGLVSPLVEPELAFREVEPPYAELVSPFLDAHHQSEHVGFAETEEEGAAAAEIPASRLEWPGAPPEQLAFMRAVYDKHVERSKAAGGTFTADLPANDLDVIVGPHQARRDAAEAARALLAEAEAALAAAGLAHKVRIGIVSAYRPASRQFEIWQGKGRKGGFPHYYRQMLERGRLQRGDYGPKAVAAMAAEIAGWIAAPGYSNHQDGLAIDFGTGAVGQRGLGAIGERAWFHRWLVGNAARFGFHPYHKEAWHWTYRRPAGSAAQPGKAPTGAVRSRELEVSRVPLLAGHRGSPPDLILRWNVPSAPAEIDVVVHLHGYWYAGVRLDRDIKPVSGLDLEPVAGATGPGRSRPTLTVIPRGNDTGVKQRYGPFNVITFPRLVTRNGLSDLVRFSLDRFAAEVGGTAPRLGRLILTAHSGGGDALLQILSHRDPEHDPHQVHVFDALYQGAGALARWAQERIRRDRAALAAPGAPPIGEYMSTQGGALRVFYQDRVKDGTRTNSRTLHGSISRDLDPRLAPWYRVEASRYDHFQIPTNYGWRVLADAAADVPDAYAEPATHREAVVGEEVEAGEVELDEAAAFLEHDFPAETGFETAVEGGQEPEEERAADEGGEGGEGGEADVEELTTPEEPVASEGFLDSVLDAIPQTIGIAQAIVVWLLDIAGGAAPAKATGFVERLIASGIRDKNKLTDIVFTIVHPQVGNRPLNKDDKNDLPLIKDWLKIRDKLVLPALARRGTAPPAATPRSPVTMNVDLAPPGTTAEQFLARHRDGIKQFTPGYPASDDELLLLVGAIMNRFQDEYFDVDGRMGFTSRHKFKDFKPPVTASSPLPLRQMMFMNRYPGKASGWLYEWDEDGNRRQRRSANPSLTDDDWKELERIADDLVYPVLRYVLPRITSPWPVVSESSGTAERAAARAYCYLGVRYRLGVRQYTPELGGLDCAALLREGRGTLDCSALVNYVYGDVLGRRLHRRGKDPDGGVDYIKQGDDFEDLGSPKPMAPHRVTPRPGDLLLRWSAKARKKQGGWSHVGIFVGDERLIDAWYTGTIVRRRVYKPEEWDRVLRFREHAAQPATGGEIASFAELFDPEGQADLLLSDEDEVEDEAVATPVERIRDALARRLWSLAVALAIQSGNRDESKLTDMVFAGRHPEREGRPIAGHEHDLVKEWLEIREQIVRPALQVTPQPAGGGLPATAGAPTGPFGTLTVDVPGWEFAYRFTPEDVEWTAKLILLESSGRNDAQNQAVIWAMFNRYALFTHKVKTYRTFTAFIRAYSTTLQPVLVNVNAARAHYGNPGSHYVPIPGAGYYPGTEIPRGQLARHLEFQKVPWSKLRDDTRSLAERALQGQVANPGIGNASEFGSSRIWWQRANKTRREPTMEEWTRYTQSITCSRERPCSWIGEVPHLDQMANAFFLDRRAEKLPPNAVRVVPAR